MSDVPVRNVQRRRGAPRFGDRHRIWRTGLLGQSTCLSAGGAIQGGCGAQIWGQTRNLHCRVGLVTHRVPIESFVPFGHAPLTGLFMTRYRDRHEVTATRITGPLMTVLWRRYLQCLYFFRGREPGGRGRKSQQIFLSAAQPQPNDRGEINALVPNLALRRAALKGATSSPSGDEIEINVETP